MSALRCGLALTFLMVGVTLPVHGELLQVDWGDVGQSDQPGWETLSRTANGDPGSPSDNASPPSAGPFSTAAGNLTFTVTSSNGTVDYRNRDIHYPRGTANYTDPVFGQIGALVEDLIKQEDASISLTIAGLMAGGYRITTFHHDAECCSFSSFNVDLNTGAGFGRVGTDISPSNNNSDPITDVSKFVADFSADGVHNVTLRYSINATPAGNPEFPFNGFSLDVPEPGTAALMLLPLASLLARRR